LIIFQEQEDWQRDWIIEDVLGLLPSIQRDQNWHRNCCDPLFEFLRDELSRVFMSGFVLKIQGDFQLSLAQVEIFNRRVYDISQK